ncbi:MAG: DMT family transporter [candidate division Zixibacteria bacterium]|nr:DMT family transporter [candidate division Zixibacteria bacterium]
MSSLSEPPSPAGPSAPVVNGPPTFPETKKRLRADLILLFVTLIWGSTFTVVKGALSDASPFFFLAVRFLLAALIFSALFYRKIFPLDFLSLRAGVAVGLCLFLGFAFQTYGLVYTSASRSAFLTSLLVLWVPFISLFVEKERPAASQWAAIGVAIAGMWFLNRPEGGRLNLGDGLTILCAFFLPCRWSF